MKKILATIFVVCIMASSVFAVNSAIGARGILGTPAGTTVESDIANIMQTQPTLSAGAGAYITLGLTELLGVQAGVNYVTHEISSVVGGEVKEVYKSNVFEIPVLALLELKLGKIGFMASVGPNFSLEVNPDVQVNGLPAVEKWNVGLYTGLALKLGLTRHIYTVAGANYVFDFTPSFSNVVNFGSNMVNNPDATFSYTRRSLVANLGLEIQFF